MRRLVFFACLSLASAAVAQETRPAVEGAKPPPARIAGLAWLEGVWEGQGISGPARETYLKPMGGQIAGHFTQTRGDGIWFYEIVTIVEKDGSLEYRLRHFNDDLTGWEEKDKVQAFPLVAVEGDSWYFADLTLRREGAEGLASAVRVRNRDGTTHELVFHYRKVH